MSKKEVENQVPAAGTGQQMHEAGKKRKRVAPKEDAGETPAKALKGFAGKMSMFEDDKSTAGTTTTQKKKPVLDAHKHSSLKRQQPKPSRGPESTSKGAGETRPVPRVNGKLDYPRDLKRRDEVPPHLLRKRDALLPVRQSLPIWPQADSIRAALKRNNVLVLTGETGSGKSTQVPQFLTAESWCTKCIAITQPRRVAAISLARRVAEEMGSFMGSQSPAAKVGYSVRFDNATGPGTKIKFLTEGMLLQEMLRDPLMSQYSAIVVDEVHERSVNVDLILGFLKNLVSELENGGSRRKEPLKVIIMSATADVNSLVKYFGDRQGPSSPLTPDTANERQISTCYVEGRQYPVKTTYLPQPTQDWVESALKLIFQIHYKEPLPGDILVFLTGQDTIEALEKLVNDYAEGMEKDVPKVSRADPGV
jgi:ATP-dependent RNA helicase DHR2